MKLRTALMVASLLLAFAFPRLLGLEADPPDELPHGIYTRELWAEGAAKAHEARNYALFGSFRTNAADNYQFWRPQAPVWVYSLTAFLKVLGVSIVSARLHSVVVAVAGFAICLLYARKRLSELGLVAFGVFLGLNYLYIQYTRVGLVEPMVNLFAAATMLCCYRTLSDPRWFTAATAALLACVFSKMNGGVLLPIVLLSGFVGLRRAKVERRAVFGLVLPSLLLLLAAGVYMTSDTYLKRVVWNVAHLAYAKEGGTAIETHRLQLMPVLERFVDGERWSNRFFVLFPVACVFAVPAVLNAARQFWRTRTLDWDGLTILWLVTMHAALQLTPSMQLRFYLTLFPPLTLLGARGLDLCIGWLGRYRIAAAALGLAAIFVSLAIDVPQQLAWYRERTYGVRDANRRISELIGKREDAVVVGLWTPWLAFQTPYKFYIVRDYFNVTKPALAQLGITHLLLKPRDGSGKIVRKRFPKQFNSKRALGSMRAYTERVTLYEVTQPMR